MYTWLTNTLTGSIAHVKCGWGTIQQLYGTFIYIMAFFQLLNYIVLDTYIGKKVRFVTPHVLDYLFRISKLDNSTNTICLNRKVTKFISR